MFHPFCLPIFTGHGLSEGFRGVLSSSQLLLIVPGYYTPKRQGLSTEFSGKGEFDEWSRLEYDRRQKEMRICGRIVICI
jgi:hypothetical protein